MSILLVKCDKSNIYNNSTIWQLNLKESTDVWHGVKALVFLEIVYLVVPYIVCIKALVQSIASHLSVEDVCALALL